MRLIMKTSFLVLVSLSLFGVVVHCYGGFDPLDELMRAKRSKDKVVSTSTWGSMELDTAKGYSPVYVGPQDGLKEADKIKSLPGQPDGVNFDQYAGYVTVDPKAGRALFYYFVESPEDPATKPLVLWLNGGPGCSSFGAGAMMELGPFRVKSDGKSLYQNDYAWNKVANVIFLESPAGVGFSYSNTTSDYELSGDRRTAQDSYTFLINWLERFPQYKTRDFFIAGESYAGHYVPQLAQLILRRNKVTKHTINLRGIAMGNALIDDETNFKGMYDYFWTHALISDEVIAGINLNCNFSDPMSDLRIPACEGYLEQAYASLGDIYIYNIYAPLCSSSNPVAKKHAEVFDPCSENYVLSYLNLPQVQRALHANLTALPYQWQICSSVIRDWKDSPTTVLPTIQDLMASGISVWLYSGDTDGRLPVTSSRYSINILDTSVETPWYPWYSQGEVGGFAVGYKNLTFVTVREAGHLVPSYQPARALTFFFSFLEGKLPPAASK